VLGGVHHDTELVFGYPKGMDIPLAFAIDPGNNLTGNVEV